MQSLFAQNINNPNKTGPLGTQVNTLTGNFFLPRNDLFIPGRGFNFSATFFYNSYDFDVNYGFGNGWGFMYGIKYIKDTASNIEIIWGDGREDKYMKQPGGNFNPPQGFFNTLSQYQPNKYLLAELDGMKYYFDNNANKRITKMQDPNGNYINFNYSDTQLVSIINTAGQTINFTYNTTGRLATMTDATAAPFRTFTYLYDNAGNLKEVTNPLGGKHKYTYLVNGPMKTMTDKNNNVVDIIYRPDLSVSELIGCNKRISFSYDTTQKKTVVADYVASGNQVTTYTYQVFGSISWVTSISGNCCGYNLKFEFDANGNKVKQTDANGNVYLFTYDSKGNVLTITDPLANTTTYTYTGNFNRIATVTDPKGNVTAMQYDANGNLVQLTEPGNQVSTATYAANGNILTSTDSKGNVYAYTYDAYGYPVSASGPNGYHAAMGFDARGNLISIVDPKNNTTGLEYDILNRLKKITDPLNQLTQLNYDANGNIISAVNKNNETSILNYDASNRVIKYTTPTGTKTELAYDAMDNITSIKNPLGHSLSLSYDTRNRLAAYRDPLNNSMTYAYDANGNITNLTLPNGQRYTCTYDAANRLVSVSDITGVVGSFGYDKNDNLISYTNGIGAVVSASYDSLDRVKTITDELGNSSAFGYDKNSNVVSYTDKNGRTSFYTYDSMNRVKTVTDNNGFVVTATYDAAGNATSLKDQNNNITTYTYDSLNRLKRTTFPDARFTEFTYDKKGNIVAKKLTDGTSIIYVYDTLDRLLAKTLPGGEVYAYSYDAIGRVINATNTSGTTTFAYDALNRIISETFGGRTVRYTYNISGRTQTILYPDSTLITKVFDTRDRLINIKKNGNDIITYQYDNADRVTAKSFANGINSSMQYDIASRITGLITSGGAIQNSSFTYDKEGNKLSVVRNNNLALSEQFTYDNGYRLTNYKRGIPAGASTVNNTYAYDAVGNRTSANLNGSITNYTINNLNQLTGNGSAVFTYDNNGNLTYDGNYYKSYDAEGRLLKDSASPVNIISYAYDALGRRIIKNTNGFPMKYTYSGLSQIEELNNANSLLNRTVYAGFLSPVLNDKSGSSYYYHQNELNSVEAISGAGGSLVERYQYDVYGKPSMFDGSGNPISASAAGNRIWFTGQEYDTATSSYKFHFRNYSTATGTFNQRDLIGYDDGMGMYQYVHNNPANGIDVFGLDDCDPRAPAPQPNLFNQITGSNEFWWSSNGASNLNSVTTAMQESRRREITQILKELMKDRGKGSVRRLMESLFKERQALMNSKVFKFINGSGAGKFLLGVNVLSAGANTIDLVSKWDSRGTGQNWDATINTGSSYVFAGGSIYTVAGGTAAAPVLIPLSGGLAIYGGVNEGVRYYTGKSLAEHGEEVEIPIWSGLGRLSGGGNFWADPPGPMPPSPDHGWKPQKPIDCPQNAGPGGKRKRKYWYFDEKGDSSEVVQPFDPNLILGPDGVPHKHWVSVKDRLSYTVLYENDSSASAPARYVRVTSPIEPKQDAATFQLGSYGFNNQTFSIPANTASYYTRLDTRDSLGVYVDVTAGYDQINNYAFWEFQAIDAITLLPPSDPNKGFLLMQDSTNPLYGHGFVNFSIKPKQTAVTLDTIGARAEIVFDLNDTIPTNIHTNTIDAFAPTSHITGIPASTTNPVNISWTGTDDPGGCGVKFYTLYISGDGVNFSMLATNIKRTDTSLVLPPDSTYCLFVLATDSVGNMETLRPGEIKCVYVGVTLPVTWLYFKGTNQNKDNLLEWATATEQNTKEFKLERSLTGSNFGAIATVPAAGFSNTMKTYQYKDLNIDKLNSTVMYYRLQQVDRDGRTAYSNIVKLNYNTKAQVNSIVYPNPTQGFITITVGDKALIGTMATIYDVNGRQLEIIKITAQSQTINMGKYVNGTYIIRLDNKEVLRIIKQ